MLEGKFGDSHPNSRIPGHVVPFSSSPESGDWGDCQPISGYSSAMIFQTVRLEDIDFSDETFRITEDLASERMMASMKKVGLVNPVVLRAGTGSNRAIVCGFRRLHALQRLGRTEALARIEPSCCSPLELFSMALLDNLSHRRLSPLECARALFVLQHACAVDQGALIVTYLPMLGLMPHQNVLRTYLNLCRLVPALRLLVREEKITLSSASRLALMATQIQERLAAVFGGIGLSASLQRKVLDLFEELGSKASGGVLEVMDRPDIAAVLKDQGLSPFQRGERVHDILRRVQSPRLCRARDRFRAREQSLGLSGKVCITPDPFFETPRIRISFEVSSSDEFRDVASALNRAAHGPALDGLFQPD